MTKTTQSIVIALVVLIVLYFSFDIRSLDSHLARPGADVFDVDVFTAQIWEKLPAAMSENAVETSTLIGIINENSDDAFNNHGHKLGISKTWYFLTRGEGILVEQDEVSATIMLDDHTTVELATLYLFGNAIREASDLVDISEFLNMMDFNQVSVYLNAKARAEAVEPFLQKASIGQRIFYSGAFEVNENSLPLEKPVIIPVSITVMYE